MAGELQELTGHRHFGASTTARWAGIVARLTADAPQAEARFL